MNHIITSKNTLICRLIMQIVNDYLTSVGKCSMAGPNGIDVKHSQYYPAFLTNDVCHCVIVLLNS